MAISAARRRRQTAYPGPSCPWCEQVIPHSRFSTGRMSCFRCVKPFEAARFDPLEPRSATPETAGLAPGENIPCARHARNQAVASCGRCGQFMCALCRIDTDGKAYCPGCFERLCAEGGVASAVTRVKNYPGRAGAMLICGVLFSFAALPFGAGALYYCVRGLKDARERGETDGRGGLITRLVLSICVMGIGILMLIALFGGFDR